MAIDWKVKFTKKDNGHFSAVFDRFDTVAPDTILQTVTIKDAILENQEQKDALWSQVKKAQEDQAAVDSEIADLESVAKTALLAKEAK